jgi:hypothetical protein
MLVVLPIMGTSIEAHLFYGYLWDDEDDYGRIACAIHGVGEDDYEPGEHSLSGWEDIILERRGHVDPWVSFPGGTDAVNKAWVAANREAIDIKLAAKDAINSEFGVGLKHHGHRDAQAPHLEITGTRLSATFTEGLAVKPETLTEDPDWRDRLDKWLAEFGISPPQPHPQWWIVAEYG